MHCLVYLLSLLIAVGLSQQPSFPEEYAITSEINSKITLSWTVQPDTQSLAVSLIYKGGPGWVGVGWNKIKHSMKDADMFVAQILTEGVVVSDYWSMHKDEEPVLDVDLGGNSSIIAQRGGVVDGVLTVEFIRPLAAEDPDYDIAILEGEELTMLLAWGEEPRLVEHEDHPVHMQVNMWEGKILVPDHHLLKIIHGVLQGLAWGLFLPVGAIVGRYKLQLSPTINWFTLHLTLQTSGIVLCLAGFITSFLMNFSHFDTVWHAQLGTTLVGLMLIQAIYAFLRPKGDAVKSKGRFYWERAHQILGIVLPLCSLLVMNSGLYHLTLSVYWSLVPFGWYAILVATIVYCEWKKRATKSGNAYEDTLETDSDKIKTDSDNSEEDRSL